jgi:hypothetical protein
MKPEEERDILKIALRTQAKSMVDYYQDAHGGCEFTSDLLYTIWFEEAETMYHKEKLNAAKTI